MRRLGEMAEAARLAEAVGARVFAAQFSRVNFPTSHPQFLGLVSPSMPDGRRALADADVVVAVGTSVFPTYFHFGGRALGAGTALVHIDSALGEIGRSEPTAVGMHADPKVGAGKRLEEAVGIAMTGIGARGGAGGVLRRWLRLRRRGGLLGRSWFGSGGMGRRCRRSG